MTNANSCTNINLTKDPDMIWGMVDTDDKIRIRFDCGDAGLIVITRAQGIDLMEQLKTFTDAIPEV